MFCHCYSYLSYTPGFLTSDDSELSLLKGDCVLNCNKELIGCAGEDEMSHRQDFMKLFAPGFDYCT